MFNYLFNIQLLFYIQLFIQHSIIYSIFNYLFYIQLFIQHLIIEYSTSTFLSPYYFWSVTKTQPRSQGFNMAAMAADVDDFDVESDLPRFLNSVL